MRFTTVMQIIKLVGSHIINRFTLRITDVKRTKMVRTIVIYYNNRPVQAAVELKNRPGVWHKAKKLSLTPGQTEVKVPLFICFFPLSPSWPGLTYVVGSL